MQVQSITPHDPGCVTRADARDFSRAALSIDRMNRVNHHCERCPDCAGLVKTAVQMATWRATR